MTKSKKKQQKVDIISENPTVVQDIAQTIIEPALQEALKLGREKGTDQEVISALTSCYGGLLVDLFGHKGAASLLIGHADHILSREEKALTN